MAAGTENRFLAAALKLQQHGFRVFPLAANSKDQPIDEDFASHASADPEKARVWWGPDPLGIEHEYNILISCRNLSDGSRLIGVDIDTKKGRDGELEVLRLELEGKELPATFEQRTPTGGRHLVYRTDALISNSRSSIASGIDIRGRGGYLVGAGSEVDGQSYVANFEVLADAPQWLVDACKDEGKRTTLATDSARVDKKYAYQRGEDHVAAQPGAIQGTRGSTAYSLACKLKDFGVGSYEAFEILLDWAARCEPPMPEDDLIFSVDNAYKYGRNEIGVGAPEMAFDVIEPEKPKPKEYVNPMDELNKEFAFIIAGGGHHILWEKLDEKGKPMLEHLAEPSFHKRFASKTMVTGAGKMEPITKIWMASRQRRSYDGFCFRPGLETPPGYYNLFRGFAVDPAGDGEVFSPMAQRSLEIFLEHAKENVCANDAPVFNWLMGYFAHLVQRPFEKPLVALVFRGGKGVGKNALVDRIGHLLGSHYLLVSNPRYLMGNFNSHFENCLFFALDEAFWSGDKKAEGTLKDLITGGHHVIEHKGQESYKVENCTRVAIIGNDDWLVPASQDERRFAVFNVGDARKQDNAYFQKMREGMEAGGYRLLLRFLLDYDISKVDVNRAPSTSGLLEQKLESMSAIHQWWMESLQAGEIVASEVPGWSTAVSKNEMRSAFYRYCRNRNIKTRIPEERAFGRALIACSPHVMGTRKVKDGDAYVNAYAMPDLEQARRDFVKFIGHEVDWQ